VAKKKKNGLIVSDKIDKRSKLKKKIKILIKIILIKIKRTPKTNIKI